MNRIHSKLPCLSLRTGLSPPVPAGQTATVTHSVSGNAQRWFCLGIEVPFKRRDHLAAIEPRSYRGAKKNARQKGHRKALPDRLL